MHITVEKDRCCGAGHWVIAAPGVFEQGDTDGLVQLLCATPPPVSHTGVREAAELGPTGAITLHEA